MGEKIVFILGAGFSKPAGAPLVDEFIREAKDIYANGQEELNELEKRFFGEVFTYYSDLRKARTKIKFDIDNIEELFSILDINISSSKEQSLGAVRKALIYLIIKTLDITINESKYNLYYDFIQRLKGGNYNFSFITFNYDLILERAMENGSYHYNYCLDLNASSIPLTEKKILKLHGSSNWLLCTNPKCRNLMLLDQKALRELYTQGCNKCKKEAIPLLIPPTWNKNIELDYFRNVWCYAFEELRQANKIIIIGYSLPETDIYFRDFLTLALKDNNYLNKIIIVNSDGRVKNKFNLFLEENFSRRYFKFIEEAFEVKSEIPKFTTSDLLEHDVYYNWDAWL